MGTVFLWLLVVAAVALIQWLRSGKIHGIPEPHGNYVVGHAFQLGGYFCRACLDWKETVGPVFQLRFLNIRVVTFNDKDSIEKVCALPQAAGRVRVGFFLRILRTFGGGISLTEGAPWVEQRQFYQKAFRMFGIGREETERSLQDEMQEKLQEWEKLDGTPFQLEGCNTVYAFNAIWKVLTSQRLQQKLVLNLARQFDRLASVETLAYAVALIYPGFTERFSNAVNEKMEGITALSDVAASSIAEHRKDRVPKQPRDVIDQILDKIDATVDESSYFHRKNLKTGYALYDLIGATLDTISTALDWFMLYLAENSRVATKLRSEIDSILGDDLNTWPTLSDRHNMPYTQACILEALRMGSITPVGFPHKALEDFEFGGAIIPKGTILIMNLYGVHFDPKVWDQPHEFKPERFLTSQGDKIDVSAKNKMVPFCAGQRSCPGSVIALDSMFLHVVNSYRKFTFQAIEWDGDVKEKHSFIRRPPPGLKLKANLRYKK